MSEKLLQEQINDLLDHAVYLQIMGSFVPTADFQQTKEIVSSTYEFIKESSEKEIREKLPHLESILTKMTLLFMNKFPLKRDIREIAKEFNGLFKTGLNVYSYGLEFGWLNAQMDLSALKFYADTPYHYRIGLATHKGSGSIEEDFLLKDAFNILVKARYYHDLLSDYGSKLKEEEERAGKKEFTEELYRQISEIKFEVGAYSRLTIISFYAFVEGFVNSIGYSYLSNNFNSINEVDGEILKGFKNGRYLQLKSKFEKFQLIIRSDKKLKITVTDNVQIPQHFKVFFEYYEQLRNSAMHYSPIKEKIWMKPRDWIDRATEFSELSMKISLEFWKACYPDSDGPEYLGNLDYNLHMANAISRADKIQKIENERKSWL